MMKRGRGKREIGLKEDGKNGGKGVGVSIVLSRQRTLKNRAAIYIVRIK